MKFYRVLLAALLLEGCQDPSTSKSFKPQQNAINLDPFLQRAPADSLPCKLDITADLPIQEIGNKLFVQAYINHSIGTFVFDTGAVQSLVTQAGANRLGLRLISKNGRTYSGIGGDRKASIYRADYMQFGRVHAAAWDFSVTDIGQKPGSGIDGLIGADILRGYDVDLDLPASRIRLFYAEHDCSHPSAFLGAPLFEVPLQRVVETHFLGRQSLQLTYTPNSPMIAVAIDGKTLKAIVDTGAASNVMFRQGFEALGITREDVLSHRGADVHGIGTGAVPASGRRFDTADIGDLEIRNAEFSLVDQEGPVSGPELILGLPLINRVHMWISHSSHTLIMQYPPSPSPAIDPKS